MKLASRIIPTEHRRIASRDVIEFECPLPPPLNSLFANAAKGRVKSRDYRNWIKEAGWIVLGLRLGHIAGPVNINILVTNRSKADTDAFFKPLLDLCVRQNLIEDDNSKIIRHLDHDFADIDGAKVTIRRVTA